jgi:hypothetical protein
MDPLCIKELLWDNWADETLLLEHERIKKLTGCLYKRFHILWLVERACIGSQLPGRVN